MKNARYPGPLVLWENADANFPWRKALGKGKNDRRLTTSDRRKRTALQTLSVRSCLGFYSSTHSPASLYTAFPAAEARRLIERFEWHYTPKHGSWLDMAESELGVLAPQCLDRRIPDKPTLITQVTAWQDNRNRHCVKADWQFTTSDARIKLKQLYPQFE